MPAGRLAMALIELLPDQLYRTCNLHNSDFTTTDDLEPLHQPLGQFSELGEEEQKKAN